MKRFTLCLVLAALTLVGCHRTKEFKTITLSGERCYEITFDEQMGPWGNTVGLKNTYSVEWPAKGLLSKEAEQELMMLCFVDNTAASPEEAAERWLGNPFFYDEEIFLEKKQVEKLDEEQEYGYVNLECTCNTDSVLAIFSIREDSYPAGAAHGLYSYKNLIVDRKTGNAIHLNDLVADTASLCKAVAQAIRGLDDNKDINECLFDEFRDVESMPMPTNFIIDRESKALIVEYGIYEITPYACGIQSIVMPIWWLSEYATLTPMAESIFDLAGSAE